MDGWDGSPGGRRYRAPYGANYKTRGLNFINFSSRLYSLGLFPPGLFSLSPFSLVLFQQIQFHSAHFHLANVHSINFHPAHVHFPELSASAGNHLCGRIKRRRLFMKWRQLCIVLQNTTSYLLYEAKLWIATSYKRFLTKLHPDDYSFSQEVFCVSARGFPRIGCSLSLDRQGCILIPDVVEEATKVRYHQSWSHTLEQ